MAVRQISALTLAVADMSRSVDFYQSILGLELLYGGPGTEFTSFRVGDGYLNLILQRDIEPSWWGRAIFYVDDVDETYRQVTGAGAVPDTSPRDAPWKERYFHLTDPDGHELSFAKPL